MNSPTCEQIQAELLDYCEQEMSAADRKRVAEHLAQCTRCNMEYKGLRAMLEKAKNLPIEDPGEAFWRQLPLDVLAQVKQARHAQSGNTGNNLVDLANRRKAPGTPPREIAKRLHYHRDFQSHRLSAALAIAAGVLLAVNIVTFSPKAGLWIDQGDFQSSIDTPNFAQLVQTAAQTNSGGASARLGFIEQQRFDQAFWVGSHLAEVFAFAHSGQYALVMERIQGLQQGLQQHPVSAVTLSSLRKAEDVLQAAPVQARQVVRLLGDFQGDYENFLYHTAPRQVVLYRSGIWLFNLNLAVAAKDAAAVRALSTKSQLDYLSAGFSRLHAAPGVQHALHAIGMSAAQLNAQSGQRSDETYRDLEKAIENLHSLLG